MFLNIINFFKKINIFTHAVEHALKIKQDIDHIDEKKFIYIDIDEDQRTIKLSFKDLLEKYNLDQDMSFDKIYKFLLKHFRYYPYNIVLNGSMVPKEYDTFFMSYNFDTTNNNSDDSNSNVLKELKSLYKKEFNSSFNEDNNSIIYFTEVYPYRVKIALFIGNENILDNMDNVNIDKDIDIDIDIDNTNDINDINTNINNNTSTNNFRIYSSSILYNDNSFPCIPEFLYQIQPKSTIKLIANIEGIDSFDQFKSQNIQTFITKKLADIISSKIQPSPSSTTTITTDILTNDSTDYIKYWKKFSYFIKQAVVLDPLFFSKIKDHLIIELKNGSPIFLNINEFLKDKNKYKYFDKYKFIMNPKYSKVEYDYINFLTDQIGSSILLDLL